jgi:hypothetical protein
MGANHSTLEGSSLGYHIIEATGPAKMAGIEIYFDFITHINARFHLNNYRRIDRNTNFQSIVKEFIGKPLGLIIYSSKTTSLRSILKMMIDVSIVPTLESGMGVKCKICDFDDHHERVWHVLDVQPESPSFVAGLRSNSDYILGSYNGAMYVKNDFQDLISKNQGKELELVVYNSEMDTIRKVFAN